MAQNDNDKSSNDGGNFNYLTREHTHRDHTVGRDVYVTDRPATLERETSRETGLPMAREIAERKDHLVKGQDY